MKPAKRTISSNRFEVEHLAKVLGITVPDITDLECDGLYEEVFRAAEREGLSDEAAEKRAQQAEEDERDETWRRWRGAFDAAATRYFEQHGLNLDLNEKTGCIKVYPEKSWRDALFKIHETMKGVGLAYYGSINDFLEAGPWTAREAVIQHLGWIKWWGKVYGEPSPEAVLRRHMGS